MVFKFKNSKAYRALFSLVVVLNNKGRTRIVCIEKPSRTTKKDFGSSKKGSRSFSHVYIYEKEGWEGFDCAALMAKVSKHE